MASISWQDIGGVRTINLEGDIDHPTAMEIEDRLQEAVATSEGDLVIVLAGVPFMSSAGIGLLIKAHQIVSRRDGRVTLSGMRDALLNILRATNLLDLFEVT